MKIKINNDYKCFMSIPNINFWYDYEGRKLFIGWLWWGIDLIFKGYDVEDADRVHSATMDSTWKPSKEEMDVLYGLAYITNQYDEHKEEVITRLYQDLKREFFNGSSYENMFPIEPCIQEGDKLVTNEDGTHFNISQLERVAKKEPKFKVGDWVVDKNGTVQQILSYKNGIYKHTNGYSSKMFEDEWRLWDITKDAKDGDVLDANGAPFIYKRHDKDYVYFYCGVNLAGAFIEANGIDTWNSNNKVYPATKEQRDLLFQKMHEAGYRWNDEKKKLGKRVIDEGKSKIDYCFTKR